MNRTTVSLALAALLASGCGSSKPDPKRDIDPALPMASSQPEDKGQGHITFRYSNKTTDASLAIDLGSTDVYLEMSGKAAQEQAEAMREAQAAPAPRKKPAKPAAPAQDDPGDSGEEKPEAGQDKPQPLAGLQPDLNKAKAQAKTAPEKKPEPPPEEEGQPYEDVTAKVLSGIRRAQELFYQKRYPEAMMAVRSSLDARSTAEGHALAGSIHFMQGQTGMARRQWMEALRLNPDMPAVVNMLEKTRTPGGRGSPSPRPVYRPAPPPAPADAPYPEEYSSPAPAPAPAAPAPVQESAAPAAATPAPAPAPQAGRSAPAAPVPVPEEPASVEATEPETAAPVEAAPAATAAAPAAAPAKPAAATPPAPAAATKAPAPAPAKTPAPDPKAAVKSPAAKDTAKTKADAKAAKEPKK